MTIRGFAVLVAVAAGFVAFYLVFTRVCSCGAVAQPNSLWLVLAWLAIAAMAAALSAYAPGEEKPTPTDSDTVKQIDATARALSICLLVFIIVCFTALAVLNFWMFDSGAARKTATVAFVL